MPKLRKSYRLGCNYWVTSPEWIDETMTVIMKAKENESGSQCSTSTERPGPDQEPREEKERKEGVDSRNTMPSSQRA